MILVTGGVRSGKSAFAEARARRLASAGGEVVYVATARVRDEEMADRVARHRAARPASWATVEAPLDLAGALTTPPASEAAVVLVDSVDLWVSNRLLEADPVDGDRVDRHQFATLEDALLGEVTAVTRAGPGRLILVTLEAGSGVVPPSPLGRAFRDLLGRVNQALAAGAEEVFLLVAGLPVDVKRLSRETIGALRVAGSVDSGSHGRGRPMGRRAAPAPAKKGERQ